MAAHWKYKEGAGVTVRSGYEEHRTAAQAHRWQEEMADSGEDARRGAQRCSTIGSMCLRRKATWWITARRLHAARFRYHIHSDVGHRCIGAKIGGRIVPFTIS